MVDAEIELPSVRNNFTDNANRNHGFVRRRPTRNFRLFHNRTSTSRSMLYSEGRRSINYSPTRWNAFYLHLVTLFFLFGMAMYREKHFGRRGNHWWKLSHSMIYAHKNQTQTRNSSSSSGRKKDIINGGVKMVNGSVVLPEEVLHNGWIPAKDVIRHDVKHFIPGKLKKQLRIHDRQKEKNILGSLHSDLEYVPSLDNYPLTLLQDNDRPIDDGDIILIWHIPKAGGTTLKSILSKCFSLRRPEQLYEKIETTTVAGISRAKSLHLTSWGTIDYIMSSRLHEVSTLLSNEHRGRMFALFRHPIETAVSLFHYLGRAYWEPHYNPEYQNMTIKEYASQDYIMDNWMTRYLSRKIKGQLNETHLQLAKDILQQKCLVGLLSDLDTSIDRMKTYYGLEQRKNETITNGTCQFKENTNTYAKISPKDEEWELLSKHLYYDLQIYDHVQWLFYSHQVNITSNSDRFSEERKWHYRHRKKPCANKTADVKCREFPQE